MHLPNMIMLLLILFTIAYSQSAKDKKMDDALPPPLQPREATLERNYVIKEVRFSSDSGAIQLAGELTRPFGEGPFPGIVLITGSGPQDRNEMIAGHRPFLILSDYLVKKGFAVLRYDDRGVGESSGDFAAALIPDFAADAASAMEWLQAQTFVDKSKTGYAGHSEGGLVAPIAIQETPAAFLILLAAPVLPLGDIFLLREQLNAKLDNADEAETEAKLKRFRAMFDAISTSKSREAAFETAKKRLIEFGESVENADAWAGAFTSPFLYWVAKYDPASALQAFQGPMLAVYGGEDTKILPDENAGKVRASVQNKASKVVIAKGLNHLFQPVQPGSRIKYEESNISFDDAALEIIGNWVDEALKSGIQNTN